MKPKVYLETTIPSLLVARPSPLLRIPNDQQMTREWWDTRRAKFQLFVSELVLQEAAKGDRTFAAQRLAAIAQCRILEATDAARSLTLGTSRLWTDPSQSRTRRRAYRYRNGAGHGFSSAMELPAYRERHDCGSSARALRQARISRSSNLHSLRTHAILARMKKKILEEVWQTRDKISAECGHDVRRLFKRLQALEAQHPERLVSFAPRQIAEPARYKRNTIAK